MTINIGNYAFDGPHGQIDNLHERSGVYAILTQGAAGSSFKVVDIGESGAIRTRIANHDRAPCWTGQAQARGLFAAAYYCDEPTRMRVEQQLRAQFNPPCGER